MVELKDSIEIRTSVNLLYEWLLDLDKHFVEWHPNHKVFEFVSKGKEIGDKIYFEEEVNGVLYAIKGEIIDLAKTKDSFNVAFKTSAGLGHIYFMGKETYSGCVFTHVEQFGLSTPIIGNVINFLLFKVLARKKANWNLILTDMREDNKRLKELLEKQ
ncbi:MAG: SRPBCC family protein [Bacteroidales bacterium]|nr:SRPBCC family protein [Bacteroidales bacterium]